MHYLELGGAEMSLIGLLHALDQERVDVDLFIYSHQGPLMKHIPKWVNLLPEISSYSVIERPITVALKRGHFGIGLGKILARLKHKAFLKKHPSGDPYASGIQYLGDFTTPFLPKINPEVEYDLCISFLTPHNVGCYKVRAKKRLAWIHTDYSTVQNDVDAEFPIWNEYDYIASISDDVTSAFLAKFPTLVSKVIQIENILPQDYILSKADEFDASIELGSYLGGGNYLIHRQICLPKEF